MKEVKPYHQIHAKPPATNLRIVMRKVILTMLLAVVGNSAIAEWFMVGSNEMTTLYADPASIIRSGKKIKIWVLADKYKTSQTAGKRYLSLVIQVEYDCKDNLSLVLNLSAHSKHMGKGKTIYVTSDPDPGGWHPVVPGSEDEILWKYICVKP